MEKRLGEWLLLELPAVVFVFLSSRLGLPASFSSLRTSVPGMLCLSRARMLNTCGTA